MSGRYLVDASAMFGRGGIFFFLPSSPLWRVRLYLALLIGVGGVGVGWLGVGQGMEEAAPAATTGSRED